MGALPRIHVGTVRGAPPDKDEADEQEDDAEFCGGPRSAEAPRRG